MRFAWFRLSATLLVAAACCGCGDKPGPPPPPVHAATGSLHYDDGAPVAKALVQFVLESNPSLNISGVTDNDGAFALKTSAGNHTLSGAIEGRCRIKIVPPCKFTPDDPPRTLELPEVYEIKQGENRFDLKIPRRK